MELMSLLSLQRYGEWYYTRYFPSIAILREKILKKSNDAVMTEEVISRLTTLFVEKNVVESYVNQYINQHKTLYFVQQKLRQKKFDSVLVKQVLESVKDTFQDPELYRKPIQIQVDKAKNKGWSKMKVSYSLRMSFSEAHELIDEILSTYDDIEILSEIVLPKIISHNNLRSSINNLLKQGFRLYDIQKVMKDNAKQ